MNTERLRSTIIGSPLERPAEWVRTRMSRRNARRHPQIAGALREGEAIDAFLERRITPTTRCFDGGAHLGSTLSQFTRLAPEARHVAIEPIPYKAEWLKAKFPRAEIVNAAVSDTAGSATFYVQPKSSAFSGLRRQESNVNDSTGTQEIEVRVVRIDDLDAGDVGVLKLDVEGAELAALRGAEATVESATPAILFECTTTGLTAFGVKPAEIYGWFAGKDYEIFLPRDAGGSGARGLTLEAFEKSLVWPFQAFNFIALPGGQ